MDLKDVETLNLCVLAYQMKMIHSIDLEFNYEFTFENQTVHTKQIFRKIEVEVKSPFKIEWELTNNNPVVSSIVKQVQAQKQDKLLY